MNLLTHNRRPARGRLSPITDRMQVGGFRMGTPLDPRTGMLDDARLEPAGDQATWEHGKESRADGGVSITYQSRWRQG